MHTVPQTVYDQFPAVAFDGMIADSAVKQVDTALADVALDCGRAVVTGGASTITDPDRVKLPTAAGDVTNKFKGVSLYQASKMPISGSANRYAIKDAVPVLRRGRVYIFPEGDMVDDGPVFVVNGSGAGTAGKFRGDANAGAATTLGANAICRRGATVASGLPAILEFNLP